MSDSESSDEKNVNWGDWGPPKTVCEKAQRVRSCISHNYTNHKRLLEVAIETINTPSPGRKAYFKDLYDELIDSDRQQKICDIVTDIAHISGYISGKLLFCKIDDLYQELYEFIFG